MSAKRTRVCCFTFALIFVLSGFAFAGSCPQADLTEDCVVDINDLEIFASQWLDPNDCEEGTCADFVEPYGIDFIDFSVLASYWQVQGKPLFINEFMASNDNDSNIADPNGDFDDWVEIYNSGSAPIDLAGMYLTDNLGNPTKWQIPAGYPAQTTVPADGFVVIWADEEPEEGPLHATFKLSAGGEDIGLFDTDGITPVDAVTFGQQVTNIAYGRYPDATDNLRFFSTPTPGADNNGAYLGQIEEVEFSHKRGFYDSSFTLTLACVTPGVNIYYTTDGGSPITGEAPAAGSILYTTPFAVNSSKPIRAAAIKTGWMPTPTETHTYIFGATSAQKSLPVIVIVGDLEESLFTPNGIMAYPTMRGIEYERPISCEVFNALPDSNFQGDCGIRVNGSDYHRERYIISDLYADWSGSYNYKKFSFKFYFRNIYGASRFDYPMFPLSDIDRWRSIVIRGGHNDAHNPFIKDEFARRLHRDTGATEGTGIMVNLFINGVYKVYYNPVERIDEEFNQEWFDSDEDWDVITQSGVRDGDSDAWNAALNYVRYNDLSNNANYIQAGNLIDIKSYIDYLIVVLYAGNSDWPNNNWTVAAEHSENGIFRFFVWDTELALQYDVLNKVGFNTFPSWKAGGGTGLNGEETPLAWIYRALKVNNEFKQFFADRIHRHFNNGGAMTNDNMLARFYELRDEMLSVIPSMDSYIANTWIPQRRAILFNAFAAEGLLWPFGAPVFNVNGSYKHGGYVSTSDTFTITDPDSSGGVIYYTLDGSDPRIAFTGAVSPTAVTYTGGFTINKSTNLKSRIYKSGTSEWSPLNEAVYGITGTGNNLRITEIMYHPLDTNNPDDPNTEYVELKNISSSTINLNLVKFDKGIDFSFGPNTLAPAEHILVVKDINAFNAKYGTGRYIAGQYSGSFNNGGERVRLLDALGTTILDFDYKDGWRSIVDGDGYSLTIINPANPDVNSWKYNDGWRASAYVNGSPGWDDSGIIPNPGSIDISEVMAHSHGGDPDWIELYNTTGSNIDIGGWYLSDDDNEPLKYRFATGTTIPANGYIVVSEDTNFGEAAADPGRLIPFALSENGELVQLTSALDANSLLTGYREKEDFGASETGVSFGRYYKASTDSYNFVPMDHNTPGAANAYPKVGPIAITEIMYHPDWPAGGNYADDEYEFIELRNISGSSVTLYDYTENEPWRFTDGIDYNFPGPPDEVTMSPGGRILVVKNLTAFSWRYPGVSPSIIYGPYNAWLANDGERLELGKPGDIDGLGQRQYIRVERVNYSDGSHPGDDTVDLWPTQADGEGKSLMRISTTQYGNDPNNWTAATPTPGT
jgi:hypothetical protein